MNLEKKQFDPPPKKKKINKQKQKQNEKQNNPKTKQNKTKYTHIPTHKIQLQQKSKFKKRIKN